ncbi:MAG: hypothetical protein ACO1OO_00105 [Flavisolibacter sp.]
MKKLLFLFATILLQLSLPAQPAPFEIELQPITIPGLGGLQSYAFAQHDGKWLIAGGRLDGLHRRQPWATFDMAGHNIQLLVVDPASLQVSKAPLSVLPASLSEQLSATNTEFYQKDKYLYIIGGYGYSDLSGGYITFANLTAIDVPGLIDAITNGKPYTKFFRQIHDPQFQVTGGRLRKIGNTFYLAGGQKFMGRYNPMGPDHGPGFVQEYTDAIRRFTIEDDGVNIRITHLPTWSDPANLHRRDLNVEPQILSNGSEGITLFSGVFQPGADLPYLNSVTADNDGYKVDGSFEQYYNHYHCAVMPLYSAASGEMHTVFFGGIAQYYFDGENRVQDDNLPFVKTIARVTRDKTGQLQEFKMREEMPSLLGAGAEFIADESVPHFVNGVLKLDAISGKTLVGYIFGGISSTAPNIFWSNNGSQSAASSQIYKVYITRNTIP